MFLDRMDDCPDKLMWALCGYLAWVEDASAYEGALTELNGLITETLDMIKNERERKAKEKEAAQ